MKHLSRGKYYFSKKEGWQGRKWIRNRGERRESKSKRKKKKRRANEGRETFQSIKKCDRADTRMPRVLLSDALSSNTADWIRHYRKLVAALLVFNGLLNESRATVHRSRDDSAPTRDPWIILSVVSRFIKTRRTSKRVLE